jgi:hypothetical protein
MRKVSLGIVVGALLATPAFGQAFVGEWIATAHSPEGDFSERLTVSKGDEGYVIDAKLLGPLPGTPEAGPATEIVLDGNHFTFKRAVSESITIVYAGVVVGDEFSGSVDIAGFQVPYSGVRLKDD